MYFSQEFPSLFSVKRANERRVFHGYKFAILSHSVLTPSKEILESIIKTGGGKLLGQIPSIKSLKQVKKLREEDPKSCHPGKCFLSLCRIPGPNGSRIPAHKSSDISTQIFLVIILSSIDKSEMEYIRTLRESGISCYSTELVLAAALKQKIELPPYIIRENGKSY